MILYRHTGTGLQNSEVTDPQVQKTEVGTGTPRVA